MVALPDFSTAFYTRNAQRYAEVSHSFLQSMYVRSSHPGLKGDWDLMQRVQELVPDGSRGLDAGCGAGARDVFMYLHRGYDIYGVDVVEENVEEARRLHPEIAGRVSLADLRWPLPYPDASFDFVLCNAVIQHIIPAVALGVTLPEFARLLNRGGVLQVMFKVGKGIATVHDKDYGVDRAFQLYPEDQVIAAVEGLGLNVVPAEGDKLGGMMYFTDTKGSDHCAFFAKKGG